MAFVVTAITAVGALTAASSFVAIATAVSYVGAAMVTVGTLTKSKELVKVGGFLSMAGGVVSLVGGAYSAAIGAAGESAAEAAAFDAWAAEVGAAEASVGIEAFGGSEAIYSGSASAGGSVAPAVAASPASNALVGAADQVAQSGGLLNSSPVETVRNQITSNIGADDVASTIQKGVDAATAAIAPPAATDSASLSSWWKGLDEKTKNSVLQIGGKAASGLFEGWTTEQKLALERERYNLEREKYDNSVENANSVPSVSYKKVPVMASDVRMNGLLNSNKV